MRRTFWMLVACAFLIGSFSCGYSSEEEVKAMKATWTKESDKQHTEDKTKALKAQKTQLDEDCARKTKVAIADAVNKALEEDAKKRNDAAWKDAEDPCGQADQSLECMEIDCGSAILIEGNKDLLPEAKLRRKISAVENYPHCIDDLDKRLRCMKNGKELVGRKDEMKNRAYLSAGVEAHRQCLASAYHEAYQQASGYSKPLPMRAFSGGVQFQIRPQLLIVVEYLEQLAKWEVDPTSVGTSMAQLATDYQRAFAATKAAYMAMAKGDDRTRLKHLMCMYTTAIEYQNLPSPGPRLSNREVARELGCPDTEAGD